MPDCTSNSPPAPFVIVSCGLTISIGVCVAGVFDGSCSLVCGPACVIFRAFFVSTALFSTVFVTVSSTSAARSSSSFSSSG